MTEKELFLWDETFPSLTLKGEGTRAFLHGQTTTDIISVQKEKIFRVARSGQLLDCMCGIFQEFSS